MYFSLLIVYKMNIYLEFQKKILFILLPPLTSSSGSVPGYGDDDEYRSPEKRKESKPSRFRNSIRDEEDEGGEEEAKIRAAIGEVQGVAGIFERQ